MKNKNLSWFAALLVFALLLWCTAATPGTITDPANYTCAVYSTALSLLPPVVAIVLLLCFTVAPISSSILLCFLLCLASCFLFCLSLCSRCCFSLGLTSCLFLCCNTLSLKLLDLSLLLYKKVRILGSLLL